MSAENNELRRPVPWFAPGHLLATGLRVFLMSVFRDFLDKRELQNGYPAEVLEASAAGEVYVDYVADTGDGFTATYSVLSQFNPQNMGHGDILVLGGDEVYPTPTVQNYDDRLIRPLAHAVPESFPEHLAHLIEDGEVDRLLDALEHGAGNDRWALHQADLLQEALERAGRPGLLADLASGANERSGGSGTRGGEPSIGATGSDFHRPWLLAIPGNHDWYDGLTAFGRQFMQPGTRIGAFETHQHRSYWAVSLEVAGKRWWLWGADLSLDGSVDRPQLDYFQGCGAAEGDPIVLFVAAPLWTYTEEASEKLYQFERATIYEYGRRLALVLSGDRHYYVRREAILKAAEGGRRRDAPPRITAGLGGAYCHPPHLEMTVPDLWEVTDEAPARSRRTLRYEPAKLPYGQGDSGVSPGAGSPRGSAARATEEEEPVYSFPTRQQSRRMSSLRHSLASWWRWNRTFAIVPFIIAFLTAVVTLEASQFWRDNADFETATQWDILSYFVLSFNLVWVLVLFGAAAILSAPDPAAAFPQAQRAIMTACTGTTLVGALWLSLWAAKEIAVRDWNAQTDVGDRTVDGLVFLLLSGVIGALSMTLVILVYFSISNRIGMSVNLMASWNLEQNYKGFLRLRFSADTVSAEMYGITDIKTEDAPKIWRELEQPRCTEALIEPKWDRAPLVLIDRFTVDR